VSGLRDFQGALRVRGGSRPGTRQLLCGVSCLPPMTTEARNGDSSSSIPPLHQACL
jgi:hypothetical protein